LSYTANMIILMILYDFCLFSAQFCYIIIYIRKVESYVQIADYDCLFLYLPSIYPPVGPNGKHVHCLEMDAYRYHVLL
jgi:hypothetical protein